MLSRATITLVTAAAITLGAAGRAAAQSPATASSSLESSLTTVTYSVADLVVPVDNHPEAGEKKSATRTREDELMKLIRTTVAPMSWSENGGSATMAYHTVGMGLVVKQTPVEHDKIHDILRNLRRLQDLEVEVVIRLVSLSEGAMNKVDFFQEGRLLSDIQMFHLLEIAQGDRSVSIMQAPKLTVFNGQKAKISVMDYHSYVTGINVVGEKENMVAQPQIEKVALGFSFSVRPVVSPDRTQVSMNLGAYLANLDGPVASTLIDTPAPDGNRQRIQIQQPKVSKIELEKSLKVADGATTIVRLGRKTSDVRNEFAPPIVSKIPYLSRLFKNAAYAPETTDLFLLVTPRIIIQEEEEKVFRP